MVTYKAQIDKQKTRIFAIRESQITYTIDNES